MKKILMAFATFMLVMYANAQKGNGNNNNTNWDLSGNTNATSNSKLGTGNGVPLRLITKGIDRIFIDTSGKIGVGTNAPFAHFDVAGVGRLRRGLVVDSGNVEIYNNGNSLPALMVQGPYTAIMGNGNNGGYGVAAQSIGGVGVSGSSDTLIGVAGYCASGIGGQFESSTEAGLVAASQYGPYAAKFYGPIWTASSSSVSDGNLKENVQELTDAMSIIQKLKPRHYDFKKDEKYAFLHLPKGNHYGLIAQELEEVLPQLVSEGKHKSPVNLTSTSADLKRNQPAEELTLKAVNYTELIPILIKGIQEQQEQIEELKKQVKTLQQGTSKKASIIETNGAALLETVPNPANESTRISYFLPSGFGQLIVTDASGNVIKKLMLDGSGSINLSTAGLSAGIYNYSLLEKGKIVDAKRFVVAH